MFRLLEYSKVAILYIHRSIVENDRFRTYDRKLQFFIFFYPLAYLAKRYGGGRREVFA